MFSVIASSGFPLSHPCEERTGAATMRSKSSFSTQLTARFMKLNYRKGHPELAQLAKIMRFKQLSAWK